MRRALLLTATAASCGALVALGIGAAAGWIGSGESLRTATTTKVVSIQAGETGQAVVGKSSSGFDPAAVYEERSSGVVTIYAFFGADGDTRGSTQGSGFVVSADGHVLTNAHVITNAGDPAGRVRPASRVYVEFGDGDRVPASVVGWDVFDDVGLLRVDRRDHALHPLPLGDSSLVRVGQPIAVIGSPFGNESSLAVGVVSATRSIASLTSRYNLVDAIQIDAPINHGNSGGPLFDARGRVIGITAQIRSESGQAEGVGFAVPANAARRTMEQLLADGRVRYAYAGISTEDLTPGIARRFGYAVSRGAVITSVLPGSPAGEAGLRGGREEREHAGRVFVYGGDVITAIGGQPVRNAVDAVRLVTERRPREAVVFSVFRGRQRLSLRVALGERPEDPDSGR